MTSFLLLSFIPTSLKAETVGNAAIAITNKTVESPDNTVTAKVAETTDINAAEVARADAQLARLEEIRAMDFSTLTPAEKEGLREEVRSIQNDQNDHYRDRNPNDGPRHHRHGGGVVFIGGGGLLLIILILLLL